MDDMISDTELKCIERSAQMAEMLDKVGELLVEIELLRSEGKSTETDLDPVQLAALYLIDVLATRRYTVLGFTCRDEEACFEAMRHSADNVMMALAKEKYEIRQLLNQPKTKKPRNPIN